MTDLIRHLSPIAVLFGFAFVFTACESTPQTEMKNARTALTAADEGHADLYVADLYRMAVDSMTAAEAEMEIQNGQSPFSRDYTRTRSLLTFVQTTATDALAEVEPRKEGVRQEAADLIAIVEAKLVEMDALMAQAPRGKDGAVALVSIQNDTDSVRTTLDTARTALANGEFAQARDLAQQATSQVQGLVDEMMQVVTKTRA